MPPKLKLFANPAQKPPLAGRFGQIIEKQRLNQLEPPFNGLGAGHFKIKLSNFWDKKGHFKLKMKRIKLEMKHFKLEMLRFKLEMRHFKPEMKLGNPATSLFKPAPP